MLSVDLNMAYTKHFWQHKLTVFGWWEEKVVLSNMGSGSAKLGVLHT